MLTVNAVEPSAHPHPGRRSTLDCLLDDGRLWSRQSANGYRYFQHDIEVEVRAFAESLLSLRR